MNKDTPTRDKIRQLIEFNPKLTNIEIANALEISRQLVSHHRTSMGMQWVQCTYQQVQQHWLLP